MRLAGHFVAFFALSFINSLIRTGTQSYVNNACHACDKCTFICMRLFLDFDHENGVPVPGTKDDSAVDYELFTTPATEVKRITRSHSTASVSTPNSGTDSNSSHMKSFPPGTKIFQYYTCPAGRVTYNFHSFCKHMYLSL